MITGLIIVQDNERTIAPVLDQLTSLTDEVVVVDGGSSDRTPEIAKTYEKVRFFERAFENDFAAQRNYAIEQAKGDWILSMDSDELLGPQFERWLRLWVKVPFVQCYRFPRYWIVKQGSDIYYCVSKIHYPDYQIRLFRNRPVARYTRQVHESITKKARGLTYKIKSAHIFHYCLYDNQEKRESKVERYATIYKSDDATNQAYIWERSGVDLVPLKTPLPGELDVG